jgi:3',5'-cyclic AMP phosphodiesterase CpdA
MEDMTLIAHLSDLHVLEDGHQRRPRAERRRLSMLSFGRPLDVHGRRERLLRGLRAAERARADHVVITGDLTEDGADEQFAALAEVLHRGPIAPERLTMVPGNHDAYSDGDAYARALAGPLAPWAPTSTPGAVTRLPGVSILAVSTAFRQHYLRSAGAIEAPALRDMQASVSRLADRGDALVFALHHPPVPHVLAVTQWWDGLQEHLEVGAILRSTETVHALHGHGHFAVDTVVRPGQPPRVFSCGAVVERDDTLRLYRTREGRLIPLEAAAQRVAPFRGAVTVPA